MLSKPTDSQSSVDLFIHVDLFVFPPLAVHNKGGGVEFQRETHCTEMAIHSLPTLNAHHQVTSPGNKVFPERWTFLIYIEITFLINEKTRVNK